jgi:hypothetical protein
MKTAKAKHTSSAHSTFTNKPFFQKNGEGTFFSDSQTGLQTKPFFSKHAAQPFIQTKLTIGQPGDRYEQEADAMADMVVQRLSNPESRQTKPATSLANTVTPLVQPKCAACEEVEQIQKKEDDEVRLENGVQLKPLFESDEPPPEEEIQRKCAECEAEEKLQKKGEADSSKNAGMPSLESRLSSSKGSGSPLPEETRAQMESSFGADFGNVRIHTGSSAVQMSKELHAQAFTHGSDIYFNSGEYSPESTNGKHLLTHELTHTVQQGGGISKIQMQRRYFGPGRQVVPQNWSARVSNASSVADRFRLVREAVGQGVTVVNRTTQSANDASPNPRHLIPFSPGNKINYDDDLNSKRSPVNRRSLRNNAGYTLHSGSRDYIVLGKQSLSSSNFYNTRVILNHEFDHIRQTRAGSRLAYTESELDAWTSTFIREFHRTYVLGDTGRTCFIQDLNQFAPLLLYYSNSSSRQAKARTIGRIRDYWTSTLRNHAAHLRVFKYWIHRSMKRSNNPSLAQTLNRNLSLNISATAGLDTTRQFPCTDVANLSYPSPPSLNVPTAPRRRGGAIRRKPIGTYKPNSSKHLPGHELTHTVQRSGNSMIQRQEKSEIPAEHDVLSPLSGSEGGSTRASRCYTDPEFPDFRCLAYALKLDIDENLWNNAHHFYRVASLQAGDNELMWNTFLRYGLGVNLLQTSFGFLGTNKTLGSVLSYGTGVGLKSYEFFQNGKLELDIPIHLGRGVTLDLKLDLNADPNNLTDIQGIQTGVGITAHF